MDKGRTRITDELEIAENFKWYWTGVSFNNQTKKLLIDVTFFELHHKLHRTFEFELKGEFAICKGDVLKCLETLDWHDLNKQIEFK